jgi:hypothetical protein
MSWWKGCFGEERNDDPMRPVLDDIAKLLSKLYELQERVRSLECATGFVYHGPQQTQAGHVKLGLPEQKGRKHGRD